MERVIDKTVTIPAPLNEVWNAWTTSEGAKTFFARDAWIDLRIGGAYELYFDHDAPRGSQGSEGCKILAFIPRRLLAFSWNAPPEFPNVRKEYASWIVVEFDSVDVKHTRVRVAHLGWKDGEEWDGVYRYFVRAWGLVLFWLDHRFRHGPINWDSPPRPTQ